MNTRNAPLSPVSVGGSEWSGINKYQNPDNYDPNNRGVISPPSSGGRNGSMSGFPGPGPGGARSVGQPSPPPSIGRSSTGMYARSESGRSMKDENNEPVLSGHYVALRKFLQQTSKMFLELSTDVYDELLRRQALSRRAPGPQVPPFLQPEDTFHPKRNQARQKLSTLGPPRFRDLATDVFCELERRFPHFSSPEGMGSPRSSSRGPSSRSGTPVSSMNGLPRGMRRPSDASSIRSGAPRMTDYGVPPSPGIPPNNYDRPQQKQFQGNVIVPNKSTMVEEDDDGADDIEDNETFGLEAASNGRESKRSEGTGMSGVMSESDKRMLEESQAQARDLQLRLDGLEDQLKKKDDELARVLDDERSKASSDNMERKQWTDMRADLENQLAQTKDFSANLQEDLARMEEQHSSEMRRLQQELEEANQSSRNENEDLRMALEEQQQVTEEVRREAQQFLREMKILSQQHGPAWERQTELEKVVESLENEVRDWRNRYARTKTQLRNMRASSLGLAIDQDAGKYIREKGFTQENGLVKDVHVTRFQISIDELLQKARTDVPDKVIDSMKAVVVSVRRITKDIDESAPNDENLHQQQQRLKSRVSATANNLITASKNFAAAAGISPVSLLDAAASHLVAAIVELLRTVKIRATPAGELEDDDDGTVTPVDSNAFFSNRSTQQDSYAKPASPQAAQSPLDPPPRFNGLGPRDSMQSSAYSPVSSPRESVNPYNQSSRNGGPNGLNGMANTNANRGPPLTPGGYGGQQQDNRAEELRFYVEDQTAVLVQTIQNLVSSVRSDASIAQINDQIDTIADVVGRVMSEAQSSGIGIDMIDRLASSRQRLLEAGEHGQDMASRGLDAQDNQWRMWTQTLPPIAFEIAREMKELAQNANQLAMAPSADDFS
ncbi:hypothetical protein PG997_012266 [Apiospora hydei]|uniref:GIT Spa2 homology (SHD) domain-containing protein n=1 Tax=Apiospora hydei TaxID=1337664 RepID=A0ABR1V2V3_9PEZI